MLLKLFFNKEKSKDYLTIMHNYAQLTKMISSGILRVTEMEEHTTKKKKKDKFILWLENALR